MGRLAIIACGKSKLDHAAPAAELYTGQYFKLCQEWVQRCSGADEYVILSAKHGVLTPTTKIEPYDVALAKMPKAKRDEWSGMVRQQLLDGWGMSTIYTVLAGADYRAALQGMPMVEDVLKDWTELRRCSGMCKPAMGIGVIKREIRQRLDRAWDDTLAVA